MDAILFLAVIVLGALLLDTRSRLKKLETRTPAETHKIRPVAAQSAAAPEAIVAPPPPPKTVRIVRSGEPVELATTSPSPASGRGARLAEQSEASRSGEGKRAPSITFESLIGGRLPIWIGGAALVLAAFFLVRYSIENGLIGPGLRVILAALFGVTLLAAAEGARRFRATAEDPRVAQALAGAGIASLYGTLYMASELYGLVGALPAFILMIAITATALGLSLRHGPPTAIMGLIGGFAAPLLTGVEAASLVPLLVYLALFTAGLFGLAIHRGWTWLALAAAGGGLLWPLALIGMIQGNALGWVGLFILGIAVASSLTLPKAGAGHAALRLAPVILGLLQLLAIGPALAFSPLAWGLYGLLAAATIVLAWRDPAMIWGAVASLVFSLVLLVIGMGDVNAPYAAIAIGLLYTAAGHAFARRAPDGKIWTAIALGGAAGPLLLYYTMGTIFPDRWVMALIAAAAAASAAFLSTRFRDRASLEPRFDLGLAGGAATAGLLAIIAVALVADNDWPAVIVAVTAAAIAAWAGHANDRWTARAAIPFALFALIPGAIKIVPLVLDSLIGDPLPFKLLPTLPETIRNLALPGLILAAAAWLARKAEGPHTRKIAIACAALPLVFAIYALVKQPLHIASDSQFLALGMLERVLITQALLAAGYATLVTQPRFRQLAYALLALGAFRIIWFDIALLNPVIKAQYVGAIPILNLAVIHPALAALWFWLAAPRTPQPRPTQAAALALVILATLGAVRQFIHGPILTGLDVTVTENWLYSAALLGLSLVWLWRGIAREGRLLRLVGLGLLTIVTVKVFLIDAAALGGILRILSFMGLGIALIAIGWAYGRFLGKPKEAGNGPPADPAPG